MIAAATNIMTRSARSSKACAARMLTPRFTGWRRCCTPGSTRAGAFWQALDHMEKVGPGPVPFALRDKSGNLYGAARANYQQAMESTGDRMESYRYPHSYPGGWVQQQYLPENMEPPGWYQPK